MMKAMKPQGYNVRLLDLPNHANSDEVAKEFMVLDSQEHMMYVTEKTRRRAMQDVNRKKNRYANVQPYDETLVALAGRPETSYINASFLGGRNVDGYFTPTAYIATQAPLSNTVDDFYRMILENEVDVVVMLTKCVEGTTVKSYKYWPDFREHLDEATDSAVPNKPEDASETLSPAERYDMQCGSAREGVPERTPDGVLNCRSVVVVPLREIDHGSYIERRLLVEPKERGLRARNITQYQLTDWPDHGCPTDSGSVRQIIRKVWEKRKQDANKTHPVVVHCSAGIGRTGAYCVLSQAIEHLWRALDEPGIEPAMIAFNLYQLTLDARACRPGMIQEDSQYSFCYRALIDEAREIANGRYNMPELAVRKQILSVPWTPDCEAMLDDVASDLEDDQSSDEDEYDEHEATELDAKNGEDLLRSHITPAAINEAIPGGRPKIAKPNLLARGYRFGS